MAQRHPFPPKHRACDGKVPHPHAQAGRDAIHALARNGKDDGPMSVYRCRHCGSFHIGHKMAKPKDHHGKRHPAPRIRRADRIPQAPWGDE